jgi:hypothetical protein
MTCINVRRLYCLAAPAPPVSDPSDRGWLGGDTP